METQIARRLGMVKYQITIHSFCHRNRPVPIARQYAQAFHGNAKHPLRDAEQQWPASHGSEYLHNHIPVPKNFATGKIIGATQNLFRFHRGQASRSHVLSMNRLAHSAGATNQRKKVESMYKASDLTYIFIPSPTINQRRTKNHAFYSIFFSPRPQTGLTPDQTLSNHFLMMIGRTLLGKATGG